MGNGRRLVGALLAMLICATGLGVAQVARAKPAFACGGVITHIAVWVQAQSPYRPPWVGVPPVAAQGSISQSPTWYCSQNGGEVAGDSKVCGAFGCNWHQRASTIAAVTSTSWTRTVNQSCRSGTHRYRTRTIYRYKYLDSFGGAIGWFDGSVPHINPNQPEYTC